MSNRIANITSLITVFPEKMIFRIYFLVKKVLTLW